MLQRRNDDILDSHPVGLRRTLHLHMLFDALRRYKEKTHANDDGVTEEYARILALVAAVEAETWLWRQLLVF